MAVVALLQRRLGGAVPEPERRGRDRATTGREVYAGFRPTGFEIIEEGPLDDRAISPGEAGEEAEEEAYQTYLRLTTPPGISSRLGVVPTHPGEASVFRVGMNDAFEAVGLGRPVSEREAYEYVLFVATLPLASVRGATLFPTLSKSFRWFRLRGAVLSAKSVQPLLRAFTWARGRPLMALLTRTVLKGFTPKSIREAWLISPSLAKAQVLTYLYIERVVSISIVKVMIPTLTSALGRDVLQAFGFDIEPYLDEPLETLDELGDRGSEDALEIVISLVKETSPVPVPEAAYERLRSEWRKLFAKLKKRG